MKPPTKRELQIIKLVAKGNTNKTIATLIGITYKSVLNHRQNIYAKLSVHSTAELITASLRRKYLSPSDFTS